MSSTLKPCAPSTPMDPRQEGWPCMGMHQPGPQTEEQVCQLACMQKMRTTPLLHGQERLHRGVTCNWCRSSTCGCCAGGAEDDLLHRQHEREDLQWEADGSSWSRTSSEWRSWAHHGGDQGQREVGQVADGSTGINSGDTSRSNDVGIYGTDDTCAASGDSKTEIHLHRPEVQRLKGALQRHRRWHRASR